MLKLFYKFWPFLFIILVWFIFSKPYFLKGLVPYSSTYQVNFFPPWSYYERFWGPVKNNAMPDVHGQIYPWKKLTIETYRHGEIPFWNPYNFSGNPHLANYQSAVFSPFNLIFFILPFIDGWSIIILLQPLLAGFFTYLFVRELGVNKLGALISSITFMFCGFMVVWMAYGTLSMAISFLPLALFAIERYYKTKIIGFIFLLMITIPLSFFSGHFQTSLYFMLALISYSMYKMLVAKHFYSTFYILLSILFGLLLSLPQLLPSIQLYSQSVRSEIFTTGGGIPIHYLVTVFAPDFFGNPVTRNDWFGFYAEWASFIGVIPLLLTLFAIFNLKKRGYIQFFLLSLLISLFLAVESPVQKFIEALKIPILSTINPTRIIVLFSFFVAVLAGFGFDNLKKFLIKKDSKKIILPFVILGILLLLVWATLILGKGMSSDKLMIAKRNLILPTFLYGGSVILIFLSRFRKEFILFSIFYFLFSSSFDSLRFAQKWMPFDPRELVFTQVPIIDAIKKHIGTGRIFGNIGAELSTYYGIPSIEGYDPLYIGRYGEFIRAANTGDFIEAERSVVKIARDGKYTNRTLDLLGVTLIFHPIADTNQGWAYPVWKDKDRFSLVYKDNKFQLFKNNNAIPRATLFYGAEVVKSNKEIIKRFYSDDFDFRNILILEEEINVSLKPGVGSAKIVSYAPNRVKIESITNTPALLFVSDNFYPGWKARVNGIETKIYRADYTFRAVVVPKGKSEVEFSYLFPDF